MNSRYFLVVLLVAVAVLLTLYFGGGSRVAQGSGENVIVLCSSCSYRGLPQQGHLILMNATTGDVWIYPDEAMSGRAAPIYWGKLVLGQPVARTK